MVAPGEKRGFGKERRAGGWGFVGLELQRDFTPQRDLPGKPHTTSKVAEKLE
jgi:hypothetical protein